MLLCISSKVMTVPNNGTMIYQHLHATANFLCLWKRYESVYLSQDDSVTDARFDVLYLLYKHCTVYLLHYDISIIVRVFTGYVSRKFTTASGYFIFTTASGYFIFTTASGYFRIIYHLL